MASSHYTYSELHFLFASFLFFSFLFFWDKVLLYSARCPGTHYIDQDGLKQTEICLPLIAGTKGMRHHGGLQWLLDCLLLIFLLTMPPHLTFLCLQHITFALTTGALPLPNSQHTSSWQSTSSSMTCLLEHLPWFLYLKKYTLMDLAFSHTTLFNFLCST